MVNWQKSILKEFTPKVARLTLVADPDGLLVEESILQKIRNQGFDLIRFEDLVTFRFAYESKYRSQWDQGNQIDLVVTLDTDENDLYLLPYDLLQTSRQLSFNLADLFPGMSYPILSLLDRGHIETLFRAKAHQTDVTMGDNATKDFILRYVFDIIPELIRLPDELLRILLRRHYQEQHIPRLLEERLVQKLIQAGWFEDWSLEKIIPDRDAFFGFLQERWPIFLNRLLERLEGNIWMTPDENVSSYGMKYRGPAVLPFDHDDVRIYVDNLFLEGFLKPIIYDNPKIFTLNWVDVGIFRDPEADLKRRLQGLIEKCRTTLPTKDSRHQDWLHFARLWSQLLKLIHNSEQLPPHGFPEQFKALRNQVDAIFQTWMEKRFAGLYNQPAIPPVMVHHIPRAIARDMENETRKKSILIVLDGLAMDQWIVLREVLNEQQPSFKFQENGVFAWVPTLTSVSRQALFSGKAPLFFPSTIQTTRQEPLLWRQFWEEQGLASHEIAYLKGVRDKPLDAVEEILSNPRVRVFALVVDKIDKIMHGMELGTAGMQTSVRQWANNGFMAELLDLCHSHGFQVYLTSDHGNIEATGCGRPSEGVVADVRGERCRIYPEKRLRNTIRKKFPNSIGWPAYGLPEGFYALLAKNRTAFIQKNNRIVGHGGISLEEVIVPFIQVENRKS